MPDESAPLMLSVSGARGIVGASMSEDVAGRYAAAYGEELGGVGGGRLRLVIGRDGRISGGELSKAVVSTLSGMGCDLIDIGVAPTPTVGIMIRKLGADGGIVITASHNPIQWNGLKCLDSSGLAPPPGIVGRVIERFEREDWTPRVAAEPGTVGREDTAVAHHVEKVLGLVDPELVRGAGLEVVLDSVNASGCEAGRMLLEGLGCDLTHLNGDQTGRFAHTPEPVAENLGELSRLVASRPSAACGFAQDPDADRLAIVDESGRYIGEEYTLVLAVLRHLQSKGPCPLVANLSTSRMIDDVAARFPGAVVHRTAVGEANVVNGMRTRDAEIGGEGNGGVIVRSIGWVRDSLVAMAMVLELLALEQRPLSSIVAELPRYRMVKLKMDLTEVGGREAIPGALERLVASHPPESVNDLDGVRIDLPEGWVHVRASNTEPILRVISEAATREEAERLAREAGIRTGLVPG